MTSNQIDIDTRNKEIFASHIGFRACAHWLQEIAYQLAVMNERGVVAQSPSLHGSPFLVDRHGA